MRGAVRAERTEAEDSDVTEGEGEDEDTDADDDLTPIKSSKKLLRKLIWPALLCLRVRLLLILICLCANGRRNVDGNDCPLFSVHIQVHGCNGSVLLNASF